MSDLPRINPDMTNFARLRIAAIALSAVAAAFVSYWAAYMIHAAITLMLPVTAGFSLTWVFSILSSIILGIGAGYRIFKELASHLDS